MSRPVASLQDRQLPELLFEGERMPHARRFAPTLWIFTAAASAAAQTGGCSEEQAQRLVKELADLRKQPQNIPVQEDYLRAFPQNYQALLQGFDYGRPLSGGHDFIDILGSLATTHEIEVGKLLVRLSNDARYEADAPSYLQHETASYCSGHAVALQPC